MYFYNSIRFTVNIKNRKINNIKNTTHGTRIELVTSTPKTQLAELKNCLIWKFALISPQLTWEALFSLMHFSAFSLCLVVLTTFPHQAQASSRGSFGRKQVGVYPSMDYGICASFVIVYGYKCHELEVIRSIHKFSAAIKLIQPNLIDWIDRTAADDKYNT